MDAKIQNISNQVVKDLDIHIELLDKGGRPFTEKDISFAYPGAFNDSQKPIKPNHIRNYGLVLFEDVPQEWSGKYRYQLILNEVGDGDV